MEAWLVNIDDALRGVATLFLDTAPIIYLVEKHPRYLDVVRPIFEHIDAGTIRAVTSPITLAECLVQPYRLDQTDLQQAFVTAIIRGKHTDFVSIDQTTAQTAAQLRAQYGLTLPDALQLAVALTRQCDALLTNDVFLKRVSGIRTIVLDELELPSG